MTTIAIITSEFNSLVTDELERGAFTIFSQDNTIQPVSYRVKGCLEIPQLTKRLLKTHPEIQGVVALGCVIRGETYHFEWVCNQTAQGLMQVSLEFDRPIIHGIIVADNLTQALERVGGKHGHKGKDAATTLLCTLHQLTQIEMTTPSSTFLHPSVT